MTLKGLDLSDVSTDEHYLRSCYDKVKHRTQIRAEKEAERLTLKLGKKMAWYYCGYCRHYHTGTDKEVSNASVVAIPGL